MRRQAGLTLLELMIVVAIAAILLAVAVPSFRTTVLNNRLIAETNRLIAEIQRARSEAATRGRRVILCATSDPSATTPACNGTAGNWGSGWIVFSDQDDNTSYNDGSDVLIGRGEPALGSVTVTANTSASTDLRFDPAGGLGNTGGNAVFRICDARGVSIGRQITVNAVGRPQVAVGTSAVPLSGC